ncbi:MAG: hypothetical protein UW68_C0005G0018 [Candidatus Collierbacteria bacterium GW2011_GWB1_44_6]|uniref:Uncharacterized protein n=2 Tax=Candidatus Collieribacteriota TaxID=1752725 RepID=A0A0G1JQH2_9BACT|nr:MAG: hypothetical protein UV68_C0001G0033 [Candidatus Collierbacteria bacterium GW2011_GWC2_43_12]KKT73625.1 MAG: hypothetical protein UW68_C0005G0018 [Candidatus Collierbacteria bacterium GW2011_GWB1_44_6]KKT84153.1 MAG: hypothetical protein UW80_C0001G0033 [Microgenomates group bacterium GW2011_GWC1_44_9]
MKIHIVTSQNLLTGLDIARILGADIALVEKSDDKTAAYILTKVGDDMMAQTVLRKHNSVDAKCDFYLILFDLRDAKAFLESKFAIEYLLGEDELEDAISLTVRKILASAIASYDLEWLGRWTNAASEASGIDLISLDLIFSEKIRSMREASVITSNPSEVREMAEEIVLNRPKADWGKLASLKGKEIVVQKPLYMLTQSAIVALQESIDDVHRFTCQKCGRPATVTDSGLGAGWKTKRFISFTSSCDHQNRFNVAEFIRRYDNTAFR